MDADLFAVKKEAAWAIANASSGGSVEQIEFLVETENCLNTFCGLLRFTSDPRLTLVVLEGLKNILDLKNIPRIGDKYIAMLDKIGAWNLIEKLQIHQNQEIYEKANHLIEEFFIPYKGMEIELWSIFSKEFEKTDQIF
eukprot:Anaeramoba_ignava/a224379_13.p1 GENE.a224379_13~~a224379_13.p1  ORF type:complete len:139 (-),score=51.96 a224379_13:53-469(-)